jgi:hypothetical protein
MEKGIQIGNEAPSSETLQLCFKMILDIIESSAEEETKRTALETVGKLSVIQNVNISGCNIKEVR